MRYKTGQRWKCTESKYGDFYFVILKNGDAQNSKLCRIIPIINSLNNSHHVIDSEYSHKHLKKYGVVELDGTVDEFVSIVCPYCRNSKWCTISNVWKKNANVINVINECSGFR